MSFLAGTLLGSIMGCFLAYALGWVIYCSTRVFVADEDADWWATLITVSAALAMSVALSWALLA